MLLKNEKVANWKLGNLGNLNFQFCPTAKIENSDLKISEKNFRVFRDFQVFQVFDLANFSSVEKIGVKTPRCYCDLESSVCAFVLKKIWYQRASHEY